MQTRFSLHKIATLVTGSSLHADKVRRVWANYNQELHLCDKVKRADVINKFSDSTAQKT